MRLVACHGRRRIVQYDQRHIRLIVKRVHSARDPGRKECGISHKGKTFSIRLYMSNALRDTDTRAHAQTGVAHVQRRRVSERIAADIAAINGLLPAHRGLDRVERRPVGTSRAQHRRSDGQCRRLRKLCCRLLFCFSRLLSFFNCRISFIVFQKLCQRPFYDLHRVLA